MLADMSAESKNDKVRESLEKSGAMEFVKTFPKEIDSYLTRGYDNDGVEMSGGQWQKDGPCANVLLGRFNLHTG